MSNIAVNNPAKLAERLDATDRPNESLNALVAHAIESRLELSDGRTETGEALAALLGEIGAIARGELPALSK